MPPQVSLHNMKIKQPAPVCQPVQGNTSTYRHKIGRSILRTAGAAQHVCQPLVRRVADRGRGRRFFLAYCVGMIVAYAILIPRTAAPGFSVLGPGDFTAFYTAARIIGSGNAHRLYDLELQTQVQQELLQPHGWTFSGGLLPYVNPPLFAMLLVFLSFMPLAWASHFWNIVNIVLVLVSVKLLLRQRQEQSNRDFVAASLIVFSFFPVLQGLVNGQSSFLVLFILTLTYLALKSNRDHLAGAILALGLVKPQLVIVVAVVMLYCRRWRVVLAFGIGSLLVLLTSWVTIGTGGVAQYIKLIYQMNQTGTCAPYPAIMPNLRGAVYRLGQLYCVFR